MKSASTKVLKLLPILNLGLMAALTTTLIACQASNNSPAATTQASTAPANGTVTVAPGQPNILATSAALTAAVAVLNTNCVNCHETILTGQAGNIQGAVININNPSYLVSSGMVIPGNPGISPLIQVVMGDEMPITGPLSDADKMTLYNWVAGVGSPAPTPAPTGGTGGGGGTPATAAQVIAILTTNCLSCHGAAGAGGVANITNLPGLVASGLVVRGNAAMSPIYGSIAAGRMPLGGAALAQADQMAIASWINAGAN